MVALRARSACLHTLQQVYASAQLASRGAGGMPRAALPALPAKHHGALRAKANEGGFRSAGQAGLVCALGCVKVGEGGGSRGCVGWSLNASMRDHGCCSTGGRLCAVRARSALPAHRGSQRTAQGAAEAGLQVPPNLNEGTAASLREKATNAAAHDKSLDAQQAAQRPASPAGGSGRSPL